MLDKNADARNDELLRAKLNRLLRVKDELWQDCLPVPPELEAKIREVCLALDFQDRGEGTPVRSTSEIPSLTHQEKQ